MSKGRRGKKKCRINHSLVAELLLKVHTVEVHLEDAEEAQPHKSTADLIGCPKLSHTCPANSKEEGPREWATNEGALPVLHVRGPSSTV